MKRGGRWPSGFGRSVISWMCWRLGRRKLARCYGENMVEIVLGTLVAIGVFVFWCDVTDSWNNVFRWAKTRMDPRRTALAHHLAHHQTRAAQEQTADQEVEVGG
jgi:hypothetical protein